MIELVTDGTSGNPELELAWVERATEAYTTLINTPRFKKLLREYFAEIFNIWKKKQHDYGSMNIGIFQERGVVIRCTDKVARLKRCYFDGEELENESPRDTWIDLTDYGIIGLMTHDKIWPGFTVEELMTYDGKDSHTSS